MKKAPVPAPAPAPAPTGAPAAQTTQSPAPTPTPEAPAPAGSEVASELTGVPAPTSPAGVVLAPHVPAPIPPREAHPALPKEAQPAAQGSLTPAQTELARKTNPAIKEAPSPVGVAPTIATVEVEKNEDGFVPGGDVPAGEVLAHEQRAARRRLEAESKK